MEQRNKRGKGKGIKERKKRRLILKRKRWEKMNGREDEGRKRRKGKEVVTFRTVVLKS